MWKLGEKWQMAEQLFDDDFFDKPMPYRWWLWEGPDGDPLNGGLAYSAEDMDRLGVTANLREPHPDLRLIDDPSIGRVWACFGCGKGLPEQFRALAVTG
ncbi:hypothetical protein [Glutamicibacter sp. V16R2B1]|uniref:hypothetical protein n=1 Tax=Glutamicibacter sp. V16R2B1 TaxID=2036207 RepID=UPI0010FD4785|nr:hypothetical protein [Glutamicibacter sp. V16R2B1]MCK9901305.1 hypothetical protein [Frankia sp. Cpl3]TLK47994.1 hypothetical protein FDN03_15520 [Glutamicibacter sp. V16R2B1]